MSLERYYRAESCVLFKSYKSLKNNSYDANQHVNDENDLIIVIKIIKKFKSVDYNLT